MLPRLNAVSSFAQLGASPAKSSFWETPTGAVVLEAYEATVFNEYADADDWIELAGAALILVLVARKCYTCWRSCSWPCCPRKARTRRRPGSARKYRSVRRRTDYSDDDDDDEAFDDVEERDYY